MIRKSILQSVAVVFFVGTLTASALAESETAKVSANEVIERNAEQIAAIGDAVYYFGELGMQEFESAKFIKGT
jgi:aminobenzoyl-glutamate utilization protein B